MLRQNRAGRYKEEEWRGLEKKEEWREYQTYPSTFYLFSLFLRHRLGFSPFDHPIRGLHRIRASALNYCFPFGEAPRLIHGRTGNWHQTFFLGHLDSLLCRSFCCLEEAHPQRGVLDIHFLSF